MLRWWASRRGRQQLGQAIWYAGWSVRCPLCGWRGREFYPHDDPHVRRNAQCPRCLAKERHRALFLYLQRHPAWIREPTSVLEIGPGFYSYRYFGRLPNVRYVGLDLAEPPARLFGDMTRLPFRQAVFDLILCFHVLEHIVDDCAALRELRRVAGTTATLLLQVPIDRQVTYEDPSLTDPRQRSLLFGQPDHVRAYGLDVTERLAGAGFRVAFEDMTSGLRTGQLRRAGLVPGDTVLVCTPHQE